MKLDTKQIEKQLEELRDHSINTILDDYDTIESMMEQYLEDADDEEEREDAQEELDIVQEAMDAFARDLRRFVIATRELRDIVGHS